MCRKKMQLELSIQPQERDVTHKHVSAINLLYCSCKFENSGGGTRNMKPV
jgi:hypothetical protein